jgi:hypothetical protein
MPDMLRPPERDRLIAYLERHLARPRQFGEVEVLALRDNTGGSTEAELCWTADTAAAVELLSLPALRPRWASLGDRLTDFLLAMGEDTLLHDRTARPGCVVDNLDPRDFRVLTGTHEFTGDLSRGLVRQALRGPAASRHSGPAMAREVLHTGNLVEFRIGKSSHCLDVEDTVVRFGLVPQQGGGVVLFHESELRAPHGLLRREGIVGTLRYEYTLRPEDPRLGLRVTLKAARGISLNEVRVTTALDELSGGPPDRPFGRIVLGADGRLRPLRLEAETLANLHQGPANSLSLVEEAQPAAAAGLHLHMPSAARLRSIKLATRAVDGAVRPHWLLTRYQAATLPGGESFTVEEERLLAAGTLAGSERAYAALLADPAPLASRDPGTGEAQGMALHAVAAQLLFAGSGAYQQAGAPPLAPERLARLRAWYDRHLLAFFAAMADAAGADAPAAPLRPGRVGLRGLGFALLSLDLAARLPATPGAPDYAALLEAGLEALLARQNSTDSDGTFTEAGGEAALDGHAAAMLLLARLALRRPEERLAAALRRGLMALRLGPPLRGGEPRAQHHPLLRARRADGAWSGDDGFRSARLGLLMRAMAVLTEAEKVGAVPLQPTEREHLQAIFDTCFRLLRGRVRLQGDDLEVLSNPVATAGDAATQPLALLALLSPDEAALTAGTPERQPA